MIIQKITHYCDSARVLFECELLEGIEVGSEAAMRYAMEKATTAGADLYGADLYGADLRGANLGGANLYGANLGGANLGGANLGGANLYGANLGGANLYGANLGGANLRGKKLVGSRPFLQIGPIGSRSDYLQAFITDAGVMVRTGCFFGTRTQFEHAVRAEHGDNEHAQEYLAALVLIDAHAKLWTPEK